MFPKSLKNMLLLSVILLVSTTGITVSQLVVHRFSSNLMETATARAENIAHKLSLEAADLILINDMVALQKMLDDQILSDPTVGYLFIVRSTSLLLHTFQDGAPVNLIPANQLTGGESFNIEKIVSQSGERFIDVAYPIFDGKAGTLRLGMTEAPYRNQVRQLWVQMSLITLGILVLSLGVSHWVISRLTRPLRQLTRYAEQIDEGSLDTQISIGGRQEVTKLATAFNSMLGRIEEHTKRLRDYTIRLELKNKELDRTHNQLKTSFSISQKISAMAKLDQICRFLVQTLYDVVECRGFYLLVFNNSARTINLATPSRIMHLHKESYDTLFDSFSRQHRLTFYNQPEICSLHLPEPLNTAGRLAMFPIRHHDMMIGAMIVLCPNDCNCIKHELELVTMILHQAAGAIHRANTHEEEILELRQRVEADAGFHGIIGKDPKMQVVFKLIEDVAPTDATVLIEGESGTGKELVALSIHERSNRAKRPFIVINCAAYPSTLLESELFGHEKGAFTGALRRKIGRFEQADGGTVFLDEVSEIDPTAQTKLLRVLQQQTIDRIGGDHPIKVNVRVLAATNKNLIEEVQNGIFREDLFYRLNVIPIKIPPLRTRRKDIHLLAEHFLKRFAGEQNKAISGFRSEAMRKLIDFNWPGNVRELENSVEHAVVLSKSSQIDFTDLPTSIIDAKAAETSEALTIPKSEEKLIREILDACDWNKAEAARQLGISRSTLYEKLKRYSIGNPTLH